MRARNVLFVINHDFGRRFGCYNDPNAHTPTIDALAERGMRFDSHWCQVPLCGPSRASLFTGCMPTTTGRFNNQPFFAEWRARTGFSPATLPESFRSAGYRTAAFGFVYHDAVDAGSWSDGHIQVPEWSDEDPAYRHVPPQLLAGWRTIEARELVRRRWEEMAGAGYGPEAADDPVLSRGARGPAVERVTGPDESYPDGVATDRAVEWLERAGQQPFFCAVGFIAGHTPFRAPARDWDRYDRAGLVLPRFNERPVGSPSWAGGDSEPAQFYTTHGYTRPWRPDGAQLRELLHGHFATLSYWDRQIGRLLAALERGGHAEDTVVVVTTDHGFHDGEHGYVGKHNMWDASLGVPLVVSGPGVAAGAAAAAMTAHVDLYPTLCDACGLAVPKHLEGRSFAHLFGAPEGSHRTIVPSWRRPMWHDREQVYDLAVSLRDRRHRWTRYLDTDGATITEELFDYESDPLETTNCAGGDVADRTTADLMLLAADPFQHP